MNLFTRQKQTCRLGKQTELQRGRMGGEIDRKFKIDMCTLLYLKQNAPPWDNNQSNACWPKKDEVYSLWDIQRGATCHMRLRVCMLWRFSHVRLFVTSWMVCSSLGSSVHGILQARILEWVAIPFSRGSSWSRDRTFVSHISQMAGGFFTNEPSVKAPQPFPSTMPWGCWGSRGRNRTTRFPSVWIRTGR